MKTGLSHPWRNTERVCRNRISKSKAQKNLEWDVKVDSKGSYRYTGNKTSKRGLTAQ